MSAAEAPWRVEPNATTCAVETNKACPVVDGNITRCRQCLTKLPCIPVCMTAKSIDPVNAKSGNCTATPYTSYVSY